MANSIADIYLRGRLTALLAQLSTLSTTDPVPTTFDAQLHTLLDEIGKVRAAIAHEGLDEVDTREVFRVTLSTANTQYEVGSEISKELDKAKAIYVHHLTTDTELRYAYTSGLVATPTGAFLHQPFGTINEITRVVPAELYYATPLNDAEIVVEILSIGGLEDVSTPFEIF